jgi:hypothetical protein
LNDDAKKNGRWMIAKRNPELSTKGEERTVNYQTEGRALTCQLKRGRNLNY